VPHQHISGRLSTALLPGADATGLWALPHIDVRLRAGTIMRPDVVLTRGAGSVTMTDASGVLLAAEITSPSSATTDRVLKKELYADAKIRWYLLIEPEMTKYQSVTLTLFRLCAGGYETYAIAKGDETLTLDDPFPVAINANGLLGIRPGRD
jgi:Uma2 family endonuclease